MRSLRYKITRGSVIQKDNAFPRKECIYLLLNILGNKNIAIFTCFQVLYIAVSSSRKDTRLPFSGSKSHFLILRQHTLDESRRPFFSAPPFLEFLSS